MPMPDAMADQNLIEPAAAGQQPTFKPTPEIFAPEA
jgi:hypothetical protein